MKSFLASDEGVAEVRERVAAAKRDGITSVPTFVVENGELIGGSDRIEEVLRAARAADAPGRVPAAGGG
ncbi:MAG: DsbA family protein [Gemmatimonadetes bacterium]|nr:DsbA family protein [Gemmatimonadota bacterium]